MKKEQVEDQQEQIEEKKEQVEENEDLIDEVEYVEPLKKAKSYVKTEARMKALETARQKKKEIALAGRKAIEEIKKVVSPMDGHKALKEEPAKPEPEPVKQPEPEPVRQKPEPVKQIQKPKPEPVNYSVPDEKLNETEIREYLKYKRAEEEEYKRVMMLKKQIEKEEKYKKGFASVFGTGYANY